MTASEKEKILNLVYLNYEKVTDSKTGTLITELATALDLLELKEQNRIIELPVLIGTDIWQIVEINDYKSIEHIIVETEDIGTILDGWGIVFFATKEEAEAKLKELNKK